MQVVSLITNVVEITDGTKPQTGPILTIPFLVEVRTTGGPVFLEMTPDAAAELTEQLARRLVERG
jgi:hypothetical protein